jgi:hypothetical protein
MTEDDYKWTEDEPSEDPPEDAAEFAKEVSTKDRHEMAEKASRRLAQEERRLEKLRDRGLALTRQELEEKADLEQRLPLLRAHIAENDRAAVYFGIDDEALDEDLGRAYEAVTTAREEEKAARTALQGFAGHQHGVEYRIAQRRFRDAQLQTAEARVAAVEVEYEQGRRAHQAAHGPQVPFLDSEASREWDLAHNYLAGLKWEPEPPKEGFDEKPSEEEAPPAAESGGEAAAS